MIAVVVVVGIAAHEIAHGVVARLVGHRLFAIEIGTGPALRRRLGRVEVTIGALPLGGAVVTGTRAAAGFRWRAVAVAAAGPAANLALAAGFALAGVGVGVVFNVVAAGANLWPGGRRRLGTPPSDGRVVLDLARGDRRVLAEERATWWSATALEQRRAGDVEAAVATVADGLAELGPTPPLLVVGGLLAMEQRRFHDAVDAYVDLIDDDEVPVASRAAVAADAAWAACLSGDRALAGLAEPWAQLAHRVEPRDTRRRAVLALAVLDAGRPDEALTLARRLPWSEGADPTGPAIEVLALVATGDAVEARARHDAVVAGRFAPDHPLGMRVERALRAP